MARWRELARKAPLDLAACLWRLSKSKLHPYEDTYNTHTGLYKRLNVLFVLLLKFVQMASNLYPPPPPPPPPSQRMLLVALSWSVWTNDGLCSGAGGFRIARFDKLKSLVLPGCDPNLLTPNCLSRLIFWGGDSRPGLGPVYRIPLYFLRRWYLHCGCGTR